MQHGRRIDGPGGAVGADQLAQPAEQSAGHLDADPGAVGLTDVVQGPFDLPAGGGQGSGPSALDDDP